MINVNLIAEYYYPVLSGAGERFRRYAPGLLERGINLNVITLSRESEIQNEIVGGVPVLRLPLDKEIGPRDGTGSISSSLLRKAKEYFRKKNCWPDILHILSYTIEGTFAVWQMRMRGVPCVNSITMMPKESQLFEDRLRVYFHQWFRYSPFNFIVTSSMMMTDRMHKQGISHRRIKTIPNGVDLNRFRPAKSPDERAGLRQKLGLDAKAEIILYIGHVEPRKCTDLLASAWLEIARKRPHAHLILAGSSDMARIHRNLHDVPDQSYEKKIDRVIKESGFSDRVLVFGQVEDVENYLRAADVFVFPSRQEGTPNVVLEAMSAGLACVVTPFEGFSSELGQSNREFSLADFSSESIARQVIDLLENQSMRLAMCKAAREFALAHFDLNDTLDLYAQMYASLVHKWKQS